MSNSFVREYSAAVWKKWWWLVVTGGVLTIAGAITFILGKTIRVPALVAIVVGLLAVIVAQVLVARDYWKDRAKARQERGEANAERDRAVAQANAVRIAAEASGTGMSLSRSSLRKARVSGFREGIVAGDSDLTEIDVKGPFARSKTPPTAEEIAAAEEAEREAARQREDEVRHGPFKYGPTRGPQSVRDEAGSRWNPDEEGF